MRNARQFHESFYKKLELFLIDRNANISEIFGEEVVAGHYAFEKSFLALAAPSMEGKTQFAFVCREIKPLYFPMSEIGESTQPIYLNFKDLAMTLYKCARKDFETLGHRVRTASLLKREFDDRKLFTLGFLKSLTSNVAYPAGQTWMEFFCSRPGFSFAPLSVREIASASSFRGFALFLDEFTNTDENRLIRNIARAVGIPTILANTNTKITNLVDRAGAIGSGSARGPSVWSLVVTKLDPAAPEALDLLSAGEELNFSQSIERILGWFPGPRNRIRRFLISMQRDILKDLRPGVAAFVAEIVKELAVEQPLGTSVSLGSFLDCVLSKLARKLRKRKNKLAGAETGTFNASLGQIALLLPESYCDYAHAHARAEADLDKSWRHPRFLEEHLFYLKNPTDASNRFLTLPSPAGQDTLLLKNGVPWEKEYTVFRPEEFFSIYGCLFIPLFRTVSTIFSYADRSSARRNTSTFNSVNPNSVFLDGNRLEVQAAVSIVRASHYHYPASSGDPIFSCKGHNALIFFRNLVFELMDTDKSIFDLNFAFHPALASFLEAVRIPYLSGVNHDNSVLAEYSTLRPGDLYSRVYIRTSNAAQIDGRFDAQMHGESGEITVACECKNRNDAVDATLLFTIFQGFQKNETRLGIVVCRHAVGRPTSKSKFARLCAANGYHIYRLVADEASFTFVPFFPRSEYSRAPTNVIIILETTVINRCS